MKLTDRKKSLIGAEASDLIHIVKTGDTTQNSAGSSYKIEIGDYKNLFSFTGGVITGDTIFNSGVTANSVTTTSIYTTNLNSTNIISDNINSTTISATTYLGLPKDIYVTGGTYNLGDGIATYTNNTGGTFNVTGITSYWSASTGNNSIVTINSENIASGQYAVAEGNGSQATGTTSHAEGFITKAGAYSHSEGILTQALGQGSHAQGNTTKSLGQFSHAEGDNTIASGNTSHAEGYFTRANGLYSHVEGSQSIASGILSHAQGDRTIASGYASHAGGGQTTANGFGSFVHGSGSTAQGDYSIVLGRNITGNTADTTYVDSLSIKSIPSGTPINNLGYDAAGRVVVGTTGITQTQINLIFSFLPKNRGYFTNYDIVGSVGNLTVQGDITSAIAETPGAFTQTVTCTMANPMSNTNYKINTSIESLGTYDNDNNQYPIVFKPISTTQFSLFFEELNNITQNLRIHLEVIDLN